MLPRWRSRDATESCDNEIAVWFLRLMLDDGALRGLGDRDGQLSEAGRDMLQSLGVAIDRCPLAKARNHIEARLELLSGEPQQVSFTTENARIFGKLLGLTAHEQGILAFVLALHVNDGYASFIPQHLRRDVAGAFRVIARALAIPIKQVRHALRTQGVLRSLPVLAVRGMEDRGLPFALADWLEGALLSPMASADELVTRFVSEAQPASVTLDDYPHLAEDVDLLLRYLEGALRTRRTGANVLLYGPPGTGKTELARALGARVGARCVETNLEDADQNVHHGHHRLAQYALSQRLLRKRSRTIVLFDECEDVFPDGLQNLLAARVPLTKAWTNRLLESNLVPAIWISNSLAAMDPAIRRRFDLVLEVEAPPRPVRRRMIERHVHALPLREGAIDALVDLDGLTPAHAQRGAAVVALCEPRDAAEAEQDLVRVLDHNLRAYRGTARTRARTSCELGYDPSLINADIDLDALATGLREARRGVLCLSGPPGTGKTELAHHLARVIGLDVALHRASDLLDKYVGETEKNIAGMFRSARRDRSLLVLDEADSFLRDRATAQRSWEVTHVNELLTQMEDFDGVLICCTNFADHLDRAALRRFALKIQLDYLRPEQSERLFRALLSTHGFHLEPPREALAAVRALRAVTPGDFAVVSRRRRLLGSPTDPNALAAEVEREVDAKRAYVPRALGFG
jgi:transitional endoplasmic reticulum ATPase